MSDSDTGRIPVVTRQLNVRLAVQEIDTPVSLKRHFIFAREVESSTHFSTSKSLLHTGRRCLQRLGHQCFTGRLVPAKSVLLAEEVRIVVRFVIFHCSLPDSEQDMPLILIVLLRVQCRDRMTLDGSSFCED